MLGHSILHLRSSIYNRYYLNGWRFGETSSKEEGVPFELVLISPSGLHYTERDLLSASWANISDAQKQEIEDADSLYMLIEDYLKQTKVEIKALADNYARRFDRRVRLENALRFCAVVASGFG